MAQVRLRVYQAETMKRERAELEARTIGNEAIRIMRMLKLVT